MKTNQQQLPAIRLSKEFKGKSLLTSRWKKLKQKSSMEKERVVGVVWNLGNHLIFAGIPQTPEPINTVCTSQSITATQAWFTQWPKEPRPVFISGRMFFRRTPRRVSTVCFFFFSCFDDVQRRMDVSLEGCWCWRPGGGPESRFMDAEQEDRVGWRQLICSGEKIRELFSLQLINHQFKC